jgi:hypothetical protein
MDKNQPKARSEEKPGQPDVVIDEPVVAEEAEVGKIEDYESDENYSDPIKWSSADESNHQRGSKWYIAWVLIIIALAGGSLAANLFLGIWQIWTTVGLAIVVFISLVVVNKQPARTISYELTNQAVIINGKSSPLSDFQAFTVTDHGKSQTISLIPTKRVSIPYDLVATTAQAGEIVDLLSSRLPIHQTGLNFTDKISSILKF